MSESSIQSPQELIHKRPHHKKHKVVDESHEKALETILFGKESDVLETISKKHKIKSEKADQKFDFFVDKGLPILTASFSESFVNEEVEDESDDSSDGDNDYIKEAFSLATKHETEEEEEVIETEEMTKRKSVWVDSDDDIVVNEAMSNAKKLPKRVDTKDKYKDYLDNKFTDLYKTPKWAEMGDRKDRNILSSDSDSDSDIDDDGLMRTAQRFKLKSKTLAKGIISIKKCTPLTNDNKVKTCLNGVQFHPTSTVALVSAPNGLVRLFQVDGKINARIQSIMFRDFRLNSAQFTKDGDELIVGSNEVMGQFFYYNMIAGKIVKIPFFKGKDKYMLEKFVISNDNQLIAVKGKEGFIRFLTVKTKEHIFDLKMNGEVMSLDFSDDSNLLFTHGNEGKVYIWDIRKRQCINRFVDEGCVSGTTITVSPDSKYCCTGSDMGVVNIYRYDDVLTQTYPKPLKSIMNLTTEVSQLKFNHSSELLLMSSKEKDNCVKCVHMNSLTVYSNFPIAGKNYGRIYSSDISLNSGYMTFATNCGTAHLYRLNNFTDY
ncbi:U3 small nucleolar RNA-associated protein 18 homolog [Oppia nitens]|uniref:U3 small nucleolar RNA-associated protein 18 homolog n=1 Tax=Oppia nitens TaxID=1686743 RepID=UPI0023DB64DE|nr:U3 small nucleolar RNA-associated protein 18 homolog [Oppia nitens]XP_054163097.1 U3 small nucleolar RNA-associated protein 18 homolog [Oppia nitens]